MERKRQKLQWMNRWMDKRGEEFVSLSRQIWNYAETGMEEINSATALCKALEENGFFVEKNLAEIPTAFMASFGEGKPVIGFLGEFDALEGLSQKAGSYMKESAEGMEHGHGCGHNLLGCGSLAAALAVRDYMIEHNLRGTVRYYGCPGEEEGCGKVLMAKAGYFTELDAALTWHPMDFTGIEGRGSLADLSMSFQFTGIAAHASSCPHMGRSALDALELLNIACNFMREHIIPEARIHYAITDTGGSAPNVIPDRASAAYEVRAPKREQAEELKKRLIRAAEGAAMMTDTKVMVTEGNSYSDYIPNDCLNRIAWEVLKNVGAPVHSKEEKELAALLRRSFMVRKEDGKAAIRAAENGEHCTEQEREAAFAAEPEPYMGPGGCLMASTDVGDVSHLVPVMQLYTASCAAGTPGHSWQMVSQTGCSIGENGMKTAARVLALTAIELIMEPEIIRLAWEEYGKKCRLTDC